MNRAILMTPTWKQEFCFCKSFTNDILGIEHEYEEVMNVVNIIFKSFEGCKLKKKFFEW